MKKTPRLVAAAALGGAVLIATTTPANAAITTLMSTQVNFGADLVGVDRVEDIVHVGPIAYVAGTFTDPRVNVAAVDTRGGRYVSAFQPDVPAPAKALAATRAAVYIGTKDEVIAVNPRTGALIWRTPVNNLESLATDGVRVFVGGKGRIPTANTKMNLAALNAATGAVDAAWSNTAPDPGRTVTSLAAYGGWLYVGVNQPSGSTAPNPVYAVSTSTGAAKPGFAYNATNSVMDISADSTGVYLAGGGDTHSCVALNSATGAQRWNKVANGDVQAVTVAGNEVWCGGHFGTGGTDVGAPFDGVVRQKLAVVDATTGTLSSFAPDVNSKFGVWALDDTQTMVMVGGDFTVIAGGNRGHYAQFKQ